MQNGVQTLGFDELLEMAETQLAQKQTENGKGDTGPVTGAEFGLTRVKVPGTDERYSYVPALTLYGGRQANGVRPAGEDQQVLLVLNATDGSVIHVSNEG